jgi:rubrerythrin
MRVSNKELLDISVNIEREAEAFYKELSSHISDPFVESYILLIAKDEAHHEKQFESVLGVKGGQKYGWENSVALRELIDKHLKPGLYPQLKGLFKNLSEFEGVQKALIISQKCEELAVKFYGTLRENCEDFETKTLLMTLESEEKSHCDFIQAVINHLEQQPN